MPNYRMAQDDVTRIAKKLIREHHPHLKNASIAFFEREPSWKSKGRIVGGMARKANDLHAALHGAELDFIIEINAEFFGSIRPEQQVALIDHELCHCGWDDENECFVIVPHDFEEFEAVIQRHGAWSEEAAAMQIKLGQMELGLVEPMPPVLSSAMQKINEAQGKAH